MSDYVSVLKTRTDTVAVTNTQSAPSATPTLTSLNYSQGDVDGFGDAIVATGTNCATVSAVPITIGGVTVNVAPTSTTPTTVTFTLPAHAAGVGTVALFGPGGTSNTLPFEYWAPSVLVPKAWVRNFAGTPWANSGSVADQLIAHGGPPTVGAAVNGHTPATFNGTTQALGWQLSFESSFLTPTDGTAIVLVKPSGLIAPSAHFYDEPQCVQGLGGNWGISVTTSGARAGLYNGADQPTTVVPCAAAAWHLLAARWTGGALKFRSDQVDAIPAAGTATGNMGASANIIGENYNGLAWLAGDMLEAFETQAAISDADLNKYRLYANQRYALTI